MEEIGIIDSNGGAVITNPTSKLEQIKNPAVVLFDQSNPDCRHTAEIIVRILVDLQQPKQTPGQPIHLQDRWLLSMVVFEQPIEAHSILLCRDHQAYRSWMIELVLGFADSVLVLLDSASSDECLPAGIIKKLCCNKQAAGKSISLLILNTIKPKAAWEQDLIQQLDDCKLALNEDAQMKVRVHPIECGILNEVFPIKLREAVRQSLDGVVKQVDKGWSGKHTGAWIELAAHRNELRSSTELDRESVDQLVGKMTHIAEEFEGNYTAEAFYMCAERALVMYIQSLCTLGSEYANIQLRNRDSLQQITHSKLNSLLEEEINVANTTYGREVTIEEKDLVLQLSRLVHGARQILQTLIEQSHRKSLSVTTEGPSNGILQTCSQVVAYLRSYKPLPSAIKYRELEAIDDQIDDLAVGLLAHHRSLPIVINK